MTGPYSQWWVAGLSNCLIIGRLSEDMGNDHMAEFSANPTAMLGHGSIDKDGLTIYDSAFG